MPPTPLLFISDSPSLRTGLGRITRDLACLTASLPEFRVGCLGRGGLGSSRLPIAQYVVPESDQTWCQAAFDQCLNDFGGRKGIVMTIWDPSRLYWFSQLEAVEFKRWGYFPVDSTGPRDKLTGVSTATIREYDRQLAYTAWGAQVIERSIGKPVDWIPHGYDADKFQPRDRYASRMTLNVGQDDIVIGCNMTNQARKDWGVAFACVSELRKAYRSLKFWVHVDVLDRHWSIPALAQDFGLMDCIALTMSGSKADEELSHYYSACDLTLLPSTEGMGYPLIESMACGTPVLHGNYGGGVEIIPRGSWLVGPRCFRLDTPYNSLRPCFEPGDWVDAAREILENPPEREECTAAVEHLRWSALWPSCWKKWMLEGLAS